MKNFIEKKFILIEAAVVERLRRAGRVELHPSLMQATFIYDDVGKRELEKVYRGTEIPYILSFMINRNGQVLDGTDLWDAIRYIDSETSYQALGFMVNCSYPTFLNPEEQPKALFSRLLGFQANSSSLSHSELDGSAELQIEDVSEWASEMLKLHGDYGVKILGGCCGTDERHLQSLL